MVKEGENMTPKIDNTTKDTILASIISEIVENNEKRDGFIRKIGNFNPSLPFTNNLSVMVVLTKQQYEKDEDFNHYVIEPVYQEIRRLYSKEDYIWKTKFAKNNLNVGTISELNEFLAKNKVSNIICSSKFIDVISIDVEDNKLDPVSQYEIMNTGKIGNYKNTIILTDLYREPLLRVLNSEETYYTLDTDTFDYNVSEIKWKFIEESDLSYKYEVSRDVGFTEL